MNGNMEKEEAIKQYLEWVTSRPEFMETVKKQIFEYLDYGDIRNELSGR